MALKPQGNNILAGTALAIAQIQSPDFVEGVSGWCIFQNGNAEFNSGTFRGFIVGGSLFIYNGTPGPGTLVASITSQTSDPFGNTTQPGGLAVYSGSAYVQMHINALLGPAIEQVTGAVSEAEHGAFYNVVTNAGLVNEIIESNWLGPGGTHDNVQSLLQQVSAAKDGSTTAGGVIYTGTAPSSFTDVAFWNAAGFKITNPPDGATYTPGHLILNATATTINSAAGVAITGLSANVGIGSYYLRCVLRCVAAASGITQVMAPRLSGTATPSGTPWRIFTNYAVEAAGTTVNPGNINGYNADPGVLPGAIPNGTVFDWTLEGIVTFSATGTLVVQGRQVTSAADETFTVQAGSFLVLEPM